MTTENGSSVPVGARRALMVAATGGHLTQLLRIEEIISPYLDDSRVATFRNEQSTSMLAGRDAYYVPRVPPRGLWQAGRAIPYALHALRSGDYTDLISTGSGVAVPFMVVGRALGIRCQFIESAARTSGPSLTGRMLRRIPGVRLATQHASWANGPWEYAGSVFDGFEREEVEEPPERPGRVVVTLGSHRGIPFRRAVEAAERLLGDLDVSARDVFWQVGDLAEEVPGRQDWVPADELDREIREADLVISHAGVGSCVQMLEAGKVPVLLPRSVEFGEVVDDHQSQVAGDLAARGLAVVARPEELGVEHARQAMSGRVVHAEEGRVGSLLTLLDLGAESRGTARLVRAEHAPETTVSVVIPTYRRPEAVVRAVRSALQQTFSPHEVLVVIDGDHGETARALERFRDPRLKIVQHAQSQGAGAARNAGVQAATGEFVAFLDDDDTWHPRKLERQVRKHLSAADPGHTVSATGARWDYGDWTVHWPLREPRTDEAIPEYLFIRRRAGEGVLLTSALMVPTDLARRIPMPERMRNHEEWDWLITLSAQGVRAVVDRESLVHYDARPQRESVSSAGQDWKFSLDWARRRKAELGSGAYAALVLTEAGRAATHAGEGLGTHLGILAASLRGRPRAWDAVRHLARPAAYRIRASRPRAER